MTDECRPPEGTPYGTVCWLETKEGKKAQAEWRGSYWRPLPIGMNSPPNFMAYLGWRFHSIATPPQEPTP